MCIEVFTFHRCTHSLKTLPRVSPLTSSGFRSITKRSTGRGNTKNWPRACWGCSPSPSPTQRLREPSPLWTLPRQNFATKWSFQHWKQYSTPSLDWNGGAIPFSHGKSHVQYWTTTLKSIELFLWDILQISPNKWDNSYFSNKHKCLLNINFI